MTLRVIRILISTFALESILLLTACPRSSLDSPPTDTPSQVSADISQAPGSFEFSALTSSGWQTHTVALDAD